MPAQGKVAQPAISYQQREEGASPQIKSTLKALREEGAAKKHTFQVGYTSAMDRTIEQLTGLKKPADLGAQIKKQKAAMEPRKRTLKAVQAACSATAASFDWRSASGSTPVRDQGTCGSCWAFATLGAYEGSHRITSSFSADTSEEDLLDCNPWGYSCNGGWWAHEYLMQKSVATEADYRYEGSKGSCSSVKRPCKAEAWGYVGDDAGVPPVASLKQALCEHGPLSVAVNVTAPFQAYTSDVFNACVAGDDINHGVTLIGWNDAKGAWLIKNSWGTDWGETGGAGTERGYMWIAYGCNNIGYGATWARAATCESKGCETCECK